MATIGVSGNDGALFNVGCEDVVCALLVDGISVTGATALLGGAVDASLDVETDKVGFPESAKGATASALVFVAVAPLSGGAAPTIGDGATRSTMGVDGGATAAVLGATVAKSVDVEETIG
jgi:hypothetical protein